ncbi:MAG: glycerate kinase [Planctomycetota bacterium]|nr:MAG: glycerate kinase [Planctomycetota bacterium]
MTFSDDGRRSLRDDAWRIWRAGLEAVRADRLVERFVRRDGDLLSIGDEAVDLRRVGRVVVVGGGKAGAGMVVGLERALGEEVLARHRVEGLVNVPADCVHATQAIRLHAARPPGVNEPRAEGVAGTAAMLELVAGLAETDVCIALLSGGGSALLPAPVEGISLDDKIAVTRALSAAGANIAELNAVRKQLSRVKGGGLARACAAGRLFALIVSDVLGDPLDVIASGPTVENSSTPAEALAVLERFGSEQAGIPRSVVKFLERQAAGEPHDRTRSPSGEAPCRATNLVIGNNATAVDAAGMEAERLGYRHAMHAAATLEGQAEEVGRHLAQMALRMLSTDGPDCLVTGGEPVVKLVPPEHRGLGGRNQQLVLAAYVALTRPPNSMGSCEVRSPFPADAVLLSAGTDGEDGPTDAAGAVVDAAVAAAVLERRLDAADYLARNDAYHFFAATGGLLKTGPTHTNVCDLRVVLVRRGGSRGRSGQAAMDVAIVE